MTPIVAGSTPFEGDLSGSRASALDLHRRRSQPDDWIRLALPEFDGGQVDA